MLDPEKWTLGGDCWQFHSELLWNKMTVVRNKKRSDLILSQSHLEIHLPLCDRNVFLIILAHQLLLHQPLLLHLLQVRLLLTGCKTRCNILTFLQIQINAIGNSYQPACIGHWRLGLKLGKSFSSRGISSVPLFHHVSTSLHNYNHNLL